MLGSTFLDKYVFVEALDIIPKKNQWGRPDSFPGTLARNPIRAFVDLGECDNPSSFSDLNQYKNADLGGFEPLRRRCVTRRVKRVLLALAQNTGEQQGHQWYRLCSVCARRRPCVSQQGPNLSKSSLLFPVGSQHREEDIVGEVPELVKITLPEQTLSLEPEVLDQLD
jgi:hypothetical protein